MSFGLKDIMEKIDETIKPLELVSMYIIWKNKEIEETKLAEELEAFIDSIIPNILEGMLNELSEQGLIIKDEEGNISLPK